MRTIIALVSTLALAACNGSAGAQEGEGISTDARGIARQSYNVGPFEGVALAGAQNVVVTVGSAPSVRAEGDAETIERMEIKVEDGTLRVGMKRGNRLNIDWSRDRPPVTVYVTMPSITSAAVAGSGDMTVNRVEGDRFSGSIAGSGDLEIAMLRVGAADFSIAGSGDIRAQGSIGKLNAAIAGSGDMDMAGVESRQADVNIVGSGDVKVRATETADITIMGSGDVILGGSARCSVTKRGSGDVRCGG